MSLVNIIKESLDNSNIVIDYIDGDVKKRVIKDIDFEYKGITYLITLEVINNFTTIKNDLTLLSIYYYLYNHKDSLKGIRFKNISDILNEKIDSEELNNTVSLMKNLSMFSKNEMKVLIEIKKNL